ncbi:MAG: hypothetical protein UW88_C0001G0065 [Candidatus Collierbacteria bacterium GW2011_GWD2_45_10]|nr:MAG: hypothetical protein UW31_C0010G0003 [Candidatus Collierbacteria bacterium GW2011_GWA2_44_13]KKT62639.1 MAG: hypothetical protein UW56_C0005G0075 [Candidatus Collierbacteria bacterium GW2011_GWD1_44_27]KKT89685.1 MAG: hypothetical protein UW88_C0001G0065 [Candidatus Collierbacteria bacterium GW2011_GWD2_45_10]
MRISCNLLRVSENNMDKKKHRKGVGGGRNYSGPVVSGISHLFAEGEMATSLQDLESLFEMAFIFR